MEGKRVRYKIIDFDLNYVEGKVIIEDCKQLEKFGTPMYIFEQGTKNKNCIAWKCGV